MSIFRGLKLTVSCSTSFNPQAITVEDGVESSQQQLVAKPTNYMNIKTQKISKNNEGNIAKRQTEQKPNEEQRALHQ